MPQTAVANMQQASGQISFLSPRRVGFACPGRSGLWSAPCRPGRLPMPDTHHSRILIIGAGPGRLHRRDLCRARQPAADAGRRAAAGRAAHDHHRRGELSRASPRSIQGPWLMEQMAAQAEHVGTRIVHGPDHRGGFLRPAVPLPRRLGRHLPGRRGDHRHRRAGALAGARVRSSACKAAASPPAPPATGSSTAASGWRWSAAATPRWRRRCT